MKMKETNNSYANYGEGDSYKMINSEMKLQNSDNEHYVSSVRLLSIRKLANGTCGFHLTRTKWDPYPWVSAVDVATPAERCGLKAGDCVLEVNNTDVLGLHISEIANLIQCQSNDVTLLLWNSGCQSDDCTAESLCRAPMPRSLQRLSVIVQSILAIIECPICLETIRPPTMQCQNGHLLCVDCRIKAVNCPVCRDHYTPRRALIAEEIYTNITKAFNLCRNEDKLRQKLFPAQLQHQQCSRRTKLHSKSHDFAAQCQYNRFEQQQKVQAEIPKQQKARMNQQRLPANKFLQKLLHRKTYSMDNLLTSEITSSTTATSTTAATTTTEANFSTDHAAKKLPTSQSVATMAITATPLQKSCTSQLINMTNDRNHLTASNSDAKPIQTATTLTTTTTTTKPLKAHKTAAENKNLAKHYSLSVNDLYQAGLHNDHLQLGQMPHQVKVAATADDGEEERLPLSLLNDTLMTAEQSYASVKCLKAITPCTCYAISSSNKLLYLGKRRPCTLPDNSNSNNEQQQQRPLQDVSNISTHSSLSSGINASMDSECSVHSLATTTSVLATSTITNQTVASYSSPTTTTTTTTDSANANVELLSASASTSTATATTAARTSLTAKQSLSALTTSSAVKLTEAPVVANSSPVMTLKSLSSTRTSLPSSPSPPSNPAAAHSASPISSNASEYSTYHSDEQCAMEQLQLKHQFSQNNYRCPCACVASFNASAALEEHIKTAHQLPIINFGTSKAKLALPLRPPTDNAILILELSNQSSNEACQVAEPKETTIFANQIENVANIKADKTCGSNKECWLRLKLNGQECIQLNVILQAAIDESCNILMTT